MAAASLRLSLQQPDGRHRALLRRSFVARCLRVALRGPAELTVRIVSPEEGRALNLGYRRKDYATNVLTFDYAREPVVMADLVLCAEVVEREAAEQHKSVADHYAHLLVHAALHAQGHDHLRARQAQAMEALEVRLLAVLGVADPYAGGAAAPD
ncbi:MAG: rRNA maturation RNase YbeY [Rubrivivax sp.]|nr:rRNA maturation RNase YbeY [Rubrivivax sp.]